MNPSEPASEQPGLSLAALAAAAAAALLASACCIAPLVLVLAGASGAWIGQLAGLESYQPYFLIGAFAAMAVAWQKIWRVPQCTDGRMCAAPRVRRLQKGIFVSVAVLLVVVLVFPLLAPFFY